VLEAGYADAYRQAHPDQAGYTFPTWDPHVRLDYLFVPRGSTARVVACAVVDMPAARLASDHFPLLTEVDD
jgi:exodeoxyribonuclease-3